MSVSKWSINFSSQPAAFGFRASTPPDNISLNSAKQESWSLSLIFRLVLVPLHMLLLTQSNSFLSSGLPCWYSFLTAWGWVRFIPLSEVHELLLRIYDILDKAVFKQVGNLAHILAYLYNFVSRQCCEVWASQFLFFIVLRRWFLLVRLACMAILIGLWHRLIWWVCLSLFLLRGVARLDHGLGSNSQYRRDLSGSVPGTSRASLPKRPHLGVWEWGSSKWQEVCWWQCLHQFCWVKKKRGVWRSALLMCQSPQPLHPPPHLHLQLFRLVCFSIFLINGEALHPTGLCLNMVQGHHLQFRCHPLLFCDFWHFNVKAAAAHHPVIQKEVDELLAKGSNRTLLRWHWFLF